MNDQIAFDSPTVRPELAVPALADATAAATLIFGKQMRHAHGPLLDLYVRLLDEWLRTGQAETRTDRLHLINLRHALLARREAAELAANPAALPDVAAAATRFARKAQSGFAASAPQP